MFSSTVWTLKVSFTTKWSIVQLYLATQSQKEVQLWFKTLMAQISKSHGCKHGSTSQKSSTMQVIGSKTATVAKNTMHMCSGFSSTTTKLLAITWLTWCQTCLPMQCITPSGQQESKNSKTRHRAPSSNSGTSMQSSRANFYYSTIFLTNITKICSRLISLAVMMKTKVTIYLWTILIHSFSQRSGTSTFDNPYWTRKTLSLPFFMLSTWATVNGWARPSGSHFKKAPIVHSKSMTT